MRYTIVPKFIFHPEIGSVIDAAQKVNLITDSWTPLAETVAALQRIPQMTINQTLLEQPAKMTATMQSLRTSIAASGIVAALETSEALRNIPLAQIQRLLSIWQPPYIPPSFLDIAVSTTPPDFAKRTPRHPRKRQIRKAARKDFLCLTRDALTYLERSAPEVLDSTKKFFQSTQFDCFLFILNGGKDCLTSGLSPEDKEAFNLIWFISTLLIAFFKYAR